MPSSRSFRSIDSDVDGDGGTLSHIRARLTKLPEKYFIFEVDTPLKIRAHPSGKWIRSNNVYFLRYKLIELLFIVLRLFYFLEFAVGAIIFALSVRDAWINTTQETQLSYDILTDPGDYLSSPYTCNVLNPRRDNYIYSKNSQESAQFSSPTFLFHDCMSTLKKLDFCSAATKRNQRLISTVGLSFNDDSCEDIILSSNLRFCYTNSTEIAVQETPAFPYKKQPVRINNIRMFTF